MEKDPKPPTYKRWTKADEMELIRLQEEEVELEDTALGRKRKAEKLQSEKLQSERDKHKKKLDDIIQMYYDQGRGPNFIESLKAAFKAELDEKYAEQEVENTDGVTVK